MYGTDILFARYIRSDRTVDDKQYANAVVSNSTLGKDRFCKFFSTADNYLIPTPFFKPSLLLPNM